MFIDLWYVRDMKHEIERGVNVNMNMQKETRLLSFALIGHGRGIIRAIRLQKREVT